MMGRIKIKSFVTGAASFLPFIRNFTCRGTGGTNNARYCYSVWFRHLMKAREAGFTSPFHTIAELGPGDSLGIGLTALLSGARSYIALDAVMHADCGQNIIVLKDVMAMLEARQSIPDNVEFPKIKPKLNSYEFPQAVFPVSWPADFINKEKP